LCRNPELHYYQGFHDVASVFLLVAGTEDEAFAMMERLSKNHIR
jgi:TBC1 domain family member 20